jgi:elongation factor Tu
MSNNAQRPAVKPTLCLTTLGASGAGKAPLAAGLARLSGAQDHRSGWTFVLSRGLRIEDAGLRYEVIGYETASRSYQHLLFRNNHEQQRALIANDPSVEGVVLMVDAEHGLTRQAREQVRLAAQVGLPAPVVLVSHREPASDLDGLDRLERAVREMLSRHGYLGDEVAIIRGGAESTATLSRLQEALDTHLPQPPLDSARELLLVIRSGLREWPEGIELICRVAQGALQTGDEVELAASRRCAPVRLLKFRGKSPTGASPGDLVRCRLDGVRDEELWRCWALTRPGVLRQCARFQAELYMLGREWLRGERLPLSGSLRLLGGEPLLSATVTAAGDARALEPDGFATVLVTPARPVALLPGVRFALYKGTAGEARRLGSGAVTVLLA